MKTSAVGAVESAVKTAKKSSHSIRRGAAVLIGVAGLGIGSGGGAVVSDYVQASKVDKSTALIRQEFIEAGAEAQTIKDLDSFLEKQIAENAPKSILPSFTTKALKKNEIWRKTQSEIKTQYWNDMLKQVFEEAYQQGIIDTLNTVKQQSLMKIAKNSTENGVFDVGQLKKLAQGTQKFLGKLLKQT